MKEFLEEVVLDGLIDVLKLTPFLFVAFLILEYIEHKMSKKNKDILSRNKKVGPLVGSFLGAFPQCGFSSLATNLFSSRVITLGTLIAVYLSTSDEMLPLMIAEKVNVLTIVKIIGTKFVIGLIFGYIIDLIYRKNHKKEEKIDSHIHDMCHDHDCHCEDGILKSSIIHTLKIALYIFIATILIGSLIYFIGEDSIKNILKHGNILTYFLASLIGLIPNCASSVIITELYLNSMISLGTLLSGTLTGAGVGLLILFKENKHIKENLMIVSIIYFIGVLIGFLIDLIGIVF